MSTTRQIKNRIKSVESTGQITRAMELVAASKMKKAQQNAMKIVPYARGLAEIANRIGAGEIVSKNKLLAKREKIEKVGVVIFAPSKGFCGSLTTNILLKTSEFIDSVIKKYEGDNLINEEKLKKEIRKDLREGVDDFRTKNLEFKIITVNREAKKIVLRLGFDELAHFSGFEDNPEITKILPLYEIIVDSFIEGTFDEVYLIYPAFKSTVEQLPVVRRILPISTSNLLMLEDSNEKKTDMREEVEKEFIFEPSKKVILDYVIPHYLKIQLLEAYLELIASEYSARMVAMRKASENADEMLDELTLAYNKQRQTAITNEIIEVSSGAQFI